MKKKIRELLIAKFGELSQDQADRVSTKIEREAKTEDDIISYIDSLTISQLLQSYSDSRVNEAVLRVKGDNSDKGATEPTGQEETHAEPQAPETEEATDPTEGIPTWAKNLIAQVEKLAGDKLTETRASRLEVVINSLPQSLQAPYRRLNLNSYNEEDFDKFIGEVETEVKQVTEEMRASSSIFSAPRSKGVNAVEAGETKATEAEIKATLDYL